MDGGQFRMPQRTSRGTVSRPEPVRRSAEEPQPAKEEPKTVTRPTSSHRGAQDEKAGKSSKRFVWLVVLVIIIVVAVGGWFAWSTMRGSSAAIDSSKYQAVFLTNGQFYFGKLHVLSDGNLRLTDVYYIQDQTSKSSTSGSDTQTATNDNNYKLIKLGDEIHGPEDAMVIPTSQVLYYENLKSDGKVSQLIDQNNK